MTQTTTAVTSGTSVRAAVDRAVVPFATIYFGRRFEVECHTDQPTRVDGATLRRIVADLLSSACRRSGIASPVRVTIEDTADAVLVTVTDQSNGFSPLASQQLMQPTRPPRRVDDAALRAAWVAREAGAVIEATEDASGTTSVRVRLPLA